MALRTDEFGLFLAPNNRYEDASFLGHHPYLSLSWRHSLASSHPRGVRFLSVPLALLTTSWRCVLCPPVHFRRGSTHLNALFPTAAVRSVHRNLCGALPLTGETSVSRTDPRAFLVVLDASLPCKTGRR